MNTPTHVHLLFEQSGTFKDAFAQFNIPATDYDLQNQYGRTDVQVDLFREIGAAYKRERSLLDTIAQGDLTIAFFPCTYFTDYNCNLFMGKAHNYRSMARAACIDYILKRAHKREQFYETAIKMCAEFERRRLRLIVENPFQTNHYWFNNFPWQPSVVDFDRRLRGDSFRKPTQYLFINCAPANGMTYQRPKNTRRIDKIVFNHDPMGNSARSEITQEYARAFIADYILGTPIQYSQLNLF